MTPEAAIAAVQAYYDAYRAESPEATTSALEAVLDPDFSLESPLVESKFGGCLTGAAAAAAAVSAAPVLKNAVVERLYADLEGHGVAALINVSTPVGVVVQSEHFDISESTRRITRLRSYYDPRKLLPDA